MRQHVRDRTRPDPNGQSRAIERGRALYCVPPDGKSPRTKAGEEKAGWSRSWALQSAVPWVWIPFYHSACAFRLCLSFLIDRTGTMR